MDKTSIVNIKKKHDYLVHEMPKGMPAFHAAYGLWLFSYRRHAASPPREDTQPRYFEFYGFAHVIKGNGWYWSDGGRKEPVGTGMCVISTPGFVQDYTASDDEYVEDSICFAGPVADQLFKCGVLANGVFPLGEERRLPDIFRLVDDPSHDAQLKANFALQQLLLEVYFKAKQKGQGSSERIDYLLEQIQATPDKWWTSSEMAEICSLSESQLRIVFRKRTGMNPKTYIDRLKIQRASEQLCNTERTITEIAESLGYMDAYHFSRRFKQLTGFAPGQYRRSNRL